MAALLPPPSGYTPLQTSWGVRIIADPVRMIGRGIRMTGVHDLAVSEALCRLTSPGDTVVDAGANVGYMTILASMAAGPHGKIMAFEPHPGLFAVAQKNVSSVRKQFNVACIELYEIALGDHPGVAELQLPPEFESNDGTARIGQPSVTGGQSVSVRLETLDHVLGDQSVAVLKLDVEGFEPQVLRGASRALSGGRIRHMVFEDHNIGKSEVVRILREAGYRIYSLGWAMRGLEVASVEVGSLAKSYEAPSFIATIEPDEVLARCSRPGWQVLSRRLTRRCTGRVKGL
jgi:FkbM family methyltransferase